MSCFHTEQDNDYEAVRIQPPTLEEEIDIVCSVRASINRQNLDHPHRQRTQETFRWKAREKPIDPEVLKDGIDRLRSLGYGQAPVLRSDMFERMIEEVIKMY